MMEFIAKQEVTDAMLKKAANIFLGVQETMLGIPAQVEDGRRIFAPPREAITPRGVPVNRSQQRAKPRHYPL